MRQPKKIKYAGELSDYPSEAILQSLADIEFIEKRKDYDVDMNYFNIIDGGVCQVCHSGAVQVRRFGVKPDTSGIVTSEIKVLYPDMDDAGIDVIEDRIYSFDHLRCGQFSSFLDAWIESAEDVKSLSNKLYLLFPHSGWVRYPQDPKIYKKNIKKIAKIIAKEGY